MMAISLRRNNCIIVLRVHHIMTRMMTWLPPESHLKSAVLASASRENLSLSVSHQPPDHISSVISYQMTDPLWTLFFKFMRGLSEGKPGNFLCQNISWAPPSLRHWTAPWKLQSKMSIDGHIIILLIVCTLLGITWPTGIPTLRRPLA